MLSRSPARRRADGDEGLVLVLIALLMVGMLLIVALVIDLSVVRSSRQSNKSAADFAAEAGAHGLENATGVPLSWQGVCRAIDYLKANKSGMSSVTTGATYTTGAGTVVTNPCADTLGAAYQTFCAPSTPSTWAVFHGSVGGVQVDIKSGYVLPDPAFPEDASVYPGDVGDPDQGGCDQLAVIISQTDTAAFGGVAGKTGYSTVIRSVGRATIGGSPVDVIALLLLDRTACSSLTTSGNNTFVRVRPGSATKSGLIHSNSNASDSNCTGSARVFEGSQYSGPPAGPSIVSEDAGAVKGIVRNRAVGGANAAWSSTLSCANPPAPNGCTVAPNPTPGRLVGRGSVDDRYLGLGSTPSRLTKLRTDASALYNLNLVSPAAPAGGFFNAACPNNNATITPVSGLTKAYFNCDLSPGPNKTITFDPAITDVVVHGSVSAQGRLDLNDVDRFYVSSTVDVNGGELDVNAGGLANCTLRENANKDHVTQMVVGAGLSSGSNAIVHLCNTFVFLGANDALPTSRDTAPATNGFNGRLSFGSQSTIDWKAPNQSLPPTVLLNSSPYYDQFEDLALWTEYSGNCNNSGPQLGGQGQITATGVFFLPNACPFGISGGGVGATITADAQFIVRRLVLTGTVGLTMAPDPANSTPFPEFQGFTLVR